MPLENITVGWEVHTALNNKITTWDVASCSLVIRLQHFCGICCSHPQSRRDSSAVKVVAATSPDPERAYGIIL
jgi:hypothetical protein